MKKVLFISYDGMTDPLGQSQVIPYLQGLTKLGYKFTLLSFEKKARFQKSGPAIASILKESGIQWVPLTFTRKPPILSKLYDKWQLKRTVVHLHREEKFSFTHCRSYVAAEAGMKLFKDSRVPYLFDMRGFWVDERIDNGQWDLKKPLFKWAYKIYKKKEQEYLAHSAHIISLTQKGKGELVKTFKVPSDKVSVIPCCADLQHFDYAKIRQGAVEELKKQLRISPETQILSYLGSLGGWYLLDEMLGFFAELKKTVPSARFLFITQDAPDTIITAAQRRGLSAEDILVAPARRDEVPLFLSLSKWSIFFIKDAYSKKASSPTKQGEIMAMGIPIICNDIGDTGKIVLQTNAGLVVDHFSVEGYQTVISGMPELDKLNKKEIRAGAFSYYDLENGINLYAGVYAGLLK